MITIFVGNYNNDSVVEKPITINLYTARPTQSRHKPFAAFRPFQSSWLVNLGHRTIRFQEFHMT